MGDRDLVNVATAARLTARCADFISGLVRDGRLPATPGRLQGGSKDKPGQQWWIDNQDLWRVHVALGGTTWFIEARIGRSPSDSGESVLYVEIADLPAELVMIVGQPRETAGTQSSGPPEESRDNLAQHSEPNWLSLYPAGM